MYVRTYPFNGLYISVFHPFCLPTMTNILKRNFSLLIFTLFKQTKKKPSALSSLSHITSRIVVNNLSACASPHRLLSSNANKKYTQNLREFTFYFISIDNRRGLLQKKKKCNWCIN